MQVTICDVCGKRIPIVKKGFLGFEVEVLDKGRITSEQWNIKSLFNSADICKECSNYLSTAIDYELLKLKQSIC